MSRKIGVVLSYVLMFFEVLSTLLLTPFIIKTLGQAEYGVFKLSASVTSYLLLLDLGVGNAVIKFISKFRIANDREKLCKFLGASTIYYLIIAVIAFICGIILTFAFPVTFAKGLSEQEIKLGQKLLLITMINAAITLGSSAYRNAITAYEKFGVSKGVSIIQIIFRMIFTYIAVKHGVGSIGIVSINLIMTVAGSLFSIFYVLFSIKLIPYFKGIETDFIKEIISYSSLILIQMIATHINATLDQILIGSLVASSSVVLAVYSIGEQIRNYFEVIGSSCTGVLMPGIVRMVENNASNVELMNEMIRIGRIIFMILGLVWGGFLVCGQQFVILWAGPENAEAFKVAMILITPYLFIMTESVGSQVLWALNKHKEQSFLKMGIVLINVAFTIVLIRWKPLLGATIGTCISLVLGDIFVMNLIFVKKIKVNLRIYYREIFKGILPCILIEVAAGFIFRAFLSSGWVSFFINVLMMCIVYAVTMFTFGMNQYEKKLLLSIFNKVK